MDPNILSFEHDEIIEDDVLKTARTNLYITNSGNQDVTSVGYTYNTQKKDGSYSKSFTNGFYTPLAPGYSWSGDLKSDYTGAVPFSDVQDFEIQGYNYTMGGRRYTVDLQQQTVTSVQETTDQDYRTEDYRQVNILKAEFGDQKNSETFAVPYTITNNSEDIIDGCLLFFHYTDQSGRNFVVTSTGAYANFIASGKSMKSLLQLDIQANDAKDIGLAGYSYAKGDRNYLVDPLDQTASSDQIRNVIPYDDSKDILTFSTSASSTDSNTWNVTATVKGNPELPVDKDNLWVTAVFLDKDGNWLGDSQMPLMQASDESYFSNIRIMLADQDLLNEVSSVQIISYSYKWADDANDADNRHGYSIYPESRKMFGY